MPRPWPTKKESPGELLCAWFAERARDLPWRRQRDPYRTWVSEVMLQQTTAKVVAPRFESFLSRFPGLLELAQAPQAEVEKAWAGLGYYRRARALQRGAQAVLERHGGEVPSELDELEALDGVGDYTSAAIRALAFDLPAIPLDGNVIRVLTRYFAVSEDPLRKTVRRRLRGMALELLPAAGPAAFAEALIELGAMVCRPKTPACHLCPLAEGCAGRISGQPESYPFKRPPPVPIPVRSLRGVARRSGRLLVQRRSRDARLLPGLWEFPGVWVEGEESVADALRPLFLDLGFTLLKVDEQLAAARHSITRYRIQSSAWAVALRGRPRRSDLRFVSLTEVGELNMTTETKKLLASWRNP